ncbi:UNVERIFIED_ORG: putative membrane protein YhfC [Variovorax guangxiensis]
MLPPEAVQVIVDLSLAAILVGCMAGFIFSRMLDRVIDLVLYLLQRRDRINAARTRDHSKVPSIHG